jgi:hypothetical protein
MNHPRPPASSDERFNKRRYLSTILVVIREDASNFVFFLAWASQLMPFARPGRTNGVFRLINGRGRPCHSFCHFAGRSLRCIQLPRRIQIKEAVCNRLPFFCRQSRPEQPFVSRARRSFHSFLESSQP